MANGICGIVILDKPEGMSSQGAVSRVKRLFGADKAGHTGTLDPLATGVLPILVGRAVKASDYLLTSDKHYSATLRLGMTADTEDVTGRILTQTDDLPAEEQVLYAVRGFLGDSTQIPPMYSALKVGGKKLYEIARSGGEIAREPRPIHIEKLTAKKLSDRDYKLDVTCSKGTYIRTLCADIGRALGCGGVMATLRRTEVHGFTEKDAVSIEQLENETQDERLSHIVPVEVIFGNAEILDLPPFFARLAHAGQEIYLSKIGHAPVPVGEKFRLYGEGGFFALGEVRDFDGKLAVKPIIQFEL